ncbi:MAG: lamin tail domain-containing protein [Sedimentisphaerales bacterium]|nr:lamin tail domain-containing protein [Sedimentisphaerales bacterium]
MHMSRRMVFSIVVAQAVCGVLLGQPGAVVINEIYQDPDLNYEWVEFIELHNPGATDVDLSGWYFSDGISFTFGAGATLPAGGYLVVAQDPIQVLEKWETKRADLPTEKVFGPFGGKLNNEGERLVLRDATGAVANEVDYQLGFPWPTVGDPIPDGTAGTSHSIQLVHPLLDNDLGGSWRSASPTPGARNTQVFTDNTPPHIRQVKHLPKQPKSGDIVSITAKITDPDGVDRVMLVYQLVDPGAYVPVTLPNYPSSNPATVHNPAYGNNWVTVEMHDDGIDGDEIAGDDIYTAQLPAAMQRHRRLVRYRFFLIDNEGNHLEVPYDDDPQPNFAYFVYDGVPAWRGAIQPGSSDPSRSEVVTYGEELMRSLPVYHLISRETDVMNCLYNSAYDNTSYYFSGTLVYDGEVYDNIHYRVRGQASTFRTGKNKLKIDFNRGHYFQPRDDCGNEYQEKWDKMNVGTGVCPWWQYPHPGSWDVGTRGMVMNEALAFRFYNMAGVPSCNTNYFQLRIIDNVAEANPNDQYEGDFWGLYFAIEQPDGAYLDEHGLAEGNMYRMDGGYNATHQGPTRIANGADVSSFISGLRSSSPDWWAQNVNLPAYYSSKAIGVAINDSDRRPESNCIYYCDAETNQWWVLPWDLDLTFEWATHYTEWERFRYALTYPPYEIACANRGRELLDLLLSSDQAGQVIDEIASIIAAPYDGKTFVEANRAMWDYHPRTSRKGQFYANNEFLRSRDWQGLIEYYKTFLSPQGFSDVASGSYGVYALIADTADAAIPNTPTVSYAGDAQFPANGLIFQASPFSDPQGAQTFAATQWRIAEVEPSTPIAPPVEPTQDGTIGLVGSDNWRYFKGLREPSVSPGVWRTAAFDDSAWLLGNTAIGFGESFITTVLDDMRGSYSTIYLRKTFDVTSLDAIDRLILELRYDDGINVWINGHLVFQDNVASAELPCSAVAEAAIEMIDWARYDLGNVTDVLVEGTNVITAQVLNASVSGSSDCFADIQLTGEKTPATVEEPIVLPGPDYQGRRGKYEIDALWQSEEITTPNSTYMAIPASVVEPGRTYRVRCRVKDTTGRWSHWSQPVQFEAGALLSAPMLDGLRITEIMYNPPAADAGRGELAVENNCFEFIELQNVGATTLDLTGVSFEDGITFSFGGSHVESLPPGGFVLVVQSEAAFLSRYGAHLAGLIAGEYDGKLANNGETLRLVDFWGGAIAEFAFSDDWHNGTDGDGLSLTLANPQRDPATWSAPSSWRASSTFGGTPGREDSAN